MRNNDQRLTEKSAWWEGWNWGLLSALLINFAIWAAIIGALVTSCAVKAAEPTKEQVEMSYALTWGLVAHDLGLAPDRRLSDISPPTVAVMPHKDLCAFIGMSEGCPALAAQLESRILVSDTLDFADPRDVTILVHEYVHYFQYVVDGILMQNQCAESRDREIYAYRVQAYVLSQLPGWGKTRAYEWVDDRVRWMQRYHGMCVKYWQR